MNTKTEEQYQDDLNWIDQKINQKKREIELIERELRFQKDELMRLQDQRLRFKNDFFRNTSHTT